ncbi:MAG TPA: AAA family ATPase [bacterium]|nr:AAA family ATPase [bacterium]
MDNKLILGFVGEIASGKGTAVDYICKKYNINSYRFSTILRDVLDRLSIEQSRSNLQDLSTTLRNTFGQDLLAKVIVKDVLKDKNQIVIVDGIRRMDDIKYLKKLSGFCVINVYTDSEIRYKRLILRSENSDDKNKTYEQFLEDAKQEAESQIREVAENADFTIDNNTTQENLHKQVDEVIDTKIKELEINL